MSYCKRDGDHKSVFITQDDLARPEVVSSLAEGEEDDDEFGVILPNGDINWDCPCLGGMPQGPCGQEFKDAFSCFHFSTAEEKGSDCIDKFKAMQECFQQYPELYKDYDETEEEEEDEREGDSKRETEEVKAASVDQSVEKHTESSVTSKQLTSNSHS